MEYYNIIYNSLEHGVDMDERFFEEENSLLIHNSLGHGIDMVARFSTLTICFISCDY